MLGRVVVFLGRMLRLLFTVNVPSFSILFTLITEAMHSSETSVLARATRRHVPEDGILHNHRCENLKPYNTLTGWAL
jgi:hypothetical protein